MPLWPLPGGVVEDAPTQQNLVSLATKGGEVEEEFLGLAVPGDSKVAFGSTAAKWEGVTVFSEKVTVEHGLGTTPTTVNATMYDNESKVLGWVTTREITATKIIMYGMYFEAPAKGSEVDIHWIAIG